MTITDMKYSSEETAPRISDREIIEALIRLEECVKTNKEMIEAMRAQITSMRIEIMGFMKWGFGLILTGMFVLVGFILWDRCSALKPVRDEINELKRKKVDWLVATMKMLSETDLNMASVLRTVGLL